MQYINFESGLDKEKARQELREARNALLEKARISAEQRLKTQENARERCEGTWMLPELSFKIDNESSRVKKKSKKHKKDKKKKHKNLNRSSDSDDCNRKTLTSNEKKNQHLSITEVRSSAKDKQPGALTNERDNWITVPGMLPTFSSSDIYRNKKEDIEEKKRLDSYKPSESTRDLNPYCKNGGDGLPRIEQKPEFKKPDDSRDVQLERSSKSYRRGGGWRKKESRSGTPENRHSDRNYNRSDKNEFDKSSGSNTQYKNIDKQKNNFSRSSFDAKKYTAQLIYTSDDRGNEKRSFSNSDSSESGSEEIKVRKTPQQFLSDEEMNRLAAKLVKAEILGNQTLITDLKNQLECARVYRKTSAKNLAQKLEESSENVIVLTHTDSRGISRPLKAPALHDDCYSKNRKNKKKKVDTHSDGSRVRYFADDDKYSLKDMFECERLNTTDDQNKQFADIVAKHTNPNDDLEDIFAEKIQTGQSTSREDERSRSRAINEHNKLSRALESCEYCIESTHMQKHLLVSMGEKVYVSLPSKEGLQRGHCLIVPMQHVSCSTLLDENVWSEIQAFRKAITRMFRSLKMDVVFFESAMFINKSPHMIIECIPGPQEDMELIPMYFKKAILECEEEWSHNKKLVDLKGRDIRKAIPKGLSYFWVDFGDDSGFAHVIEEQERFPRYFAQEIIGGLLGLQPRLWRNPKKQYLPIQKVTEFGKMWKPFDITS